MRCCTCAVLNVCNIAGVDRGGVLYCSGYTYDFSVYGSVILWRCNITDVQCCGCDSYGCTVLWGMCSGMCVWCHGCAVLIVWIVGVRGVLLGGVMTVECNWSAIW